MPGSLLTPDDPEETARLEQAVRRAPGLEAQAHADGHTGQRTLGGDREKSLTAGD